MELKTTVKLSVSDVQSVSFEDYDTDEFAIAKIGFLSTQPNSHGLAISEKVLREYAPSVLGKWIVVDIDKLTHDATTHTDNQNIVGIVPAGQTVEFVYDDNGFLRAYAYAIISKIYAKDFCEIFANDNDRAVSVEMQVETEDGRDLDDIVKALKIVGVTVLGKSVRPSVPDADIEFVRFSKYFTTFKERTEGMADYVNHPVNTSKDAIYEGDWDGDKAKEDLIKEENYNTLAPKVCLRLEEGWKNREVTKLGYPVMGLYEGEWRYSRKGLASALAYAKQAGDKDIVSKVEKIYKELDLDNSDGKEDKQAMSEIEFAAVDIGNLWCALSDALTERYPDRDWGSIYRVDGIYEEDNTKFAIIYRQGEETKYRLDFSLTEEGLTLSDEIVEVKIEIIPTDNIRKFAEPADAEKYKEFVCDTKAESCEDCDSECDDKQDGADLAKCECEDDKLDDKDEPDEVEMTADEMKAKIAEMEVAINERDNIIMEKDNVIAELEAFKTACEEKEKTMAVEQLLGELGKFMTSDMANEYRQEAKCVAFAELDAWKNKVKASVVDTVMKNGSSKNTDFTRMSGIVETEQKGNSVWSRL